MTDLAGAVQKALFDKLSAIDGLPQVVTEPPVTTQGSVEIVLYPFILLGDDQIDEQGSKDGSFERHEPSIHACFQSTTKKEVRAAQALIKAALHEQTIAADGADLSDPVALHQSIDTLEDGATQVGTQTFLIFAQDG